MEEINFIRPQEVFNRDTGESKVRYTSYDGSNRFIPVVEGEDGVPKTLTKVTWQELKNKRDASKLTPGALYRITDYNCTTTQENTQSAGHQFDIVVLALSEDTLSEEAWAMPHDGDEYFQNSNLSAWKVWYCLDNDKSRFAWADDRLILHQITISSSSVDYIRTPESDLTIDGVGYYAWVWTGQGSSTKFTLSETPKHGDALYQNFGGMQKTGEVDKIFTNGRGVIYRLIDEYNNDIKYDFKNIQFVRKLTDGQYDADNGTNTWCYTLNVWYNDMCQDASIVGNTLPNDEGYINGVYDNIFGYATAYDFLIEGMDTFALALGGNVVLSFDDDGYYGIYSNTIGNGFNSNTIGNGFYSNTIGNGFNSNTIGNGFYSNTIGNGSYSNTIGNSFNSNTIGNGFYSNTIGNGFNSNTIGNGINSNTIGNGFYSNTIGNNFYSNTIGNSFNSNTIGNGSYSNTIGNGINSNTIGNNFHNKTISDSTSGKNYGNNGVELATKS